MAEQVFSENFSGELVQEVTDGIVKINFVNGKKEGVTRFISKSSGLTLSEINYKSDMIHGETRQYYPTGELFSISEYQNNVQNGKFMVFFTNGMTQIECNYLDGFIDGLHCTYDEFGDLISESYYQKGKKHGKNLVYYPKAQGGNVHELSYFENGLLSGDRITFYQTGEILSVTPYYLGKPQAYTKNYSKDGEEI